MYPFADSARLQYGLNQNLRLRTISHRLQMNSWSLGQSRNYLLPKGSMCLRAVICCLLVDVSTWSTTRDRQESQGRSVRGIVHGSFALRVLYLLLTNIIPAAILAAVSVPIMKDVSFGLRSSDRRSLLQGHPKATSRRQQLRQPLGVFLLEIKRNT